MKSKTLRELKMQLKLSAHLIKEKKAIWRKTVSQLAKAEKNTSIWHNKDLCALTTDLSKIQFDFRHKHIVYCLLRGKTREQIEMPKKGNLPNEDAIQDFLSHYMAALAQEAEEANHEALCHRSV